MTEAVRKQLEKYHADLSAIEPRWTTWPRVEEWARGIRPFLSQHFPDALPDFAELAVRPNVPGVVFVGAPGHPLSTMRWSIPESESS